MKFKYALRSARKNPLVTTVAVLSLALGIGANTAIFSLIDQLLLRMLPVEGPQLLVQLAARGPYYGAQWGEDRMSYPMYRDFRDKATVFSGVLAWYAAPASLGYGGRTELIRSELVTGDYFRTDGDAAASEPGTQCRAARIRSRVSKEPLGQCLRQAEAGSRNGTGSGGRCAPLPADH